MRNRTGLVAGFIILLGVLSITGSPQLALAASDCTFTEDPDTLTMALDADCMTDETIGIPDGWTLDGQGHAITAVDPTGSHFTGAVVANEGVEAYVTQLTVRAEGLSNACDGGADRLRGIMLEGASGAITHSTILDINQGASGCQEGNAIEIRNEPFDGTHPNTTIVEIAHNSIERYQKTGIVANGDVDVSIQHNTVGASATQANLAANSIQLGFGAMGSVLHNLIDGNQWLGTSDFAATAILVFEASEGVAVSQNNVRGNSDVGIYILADAGIYDNNKVFDEGEDGPHGDYGLLNDGVDNLITNNKVRGFDTPYDGVEVGKNKSIPGPQDFD